MTNRSDYPTVTEEPPYPFWIRNPHVFGVVLIGGMVALGGTLGVLLATEATMPLLIPIGGWAVAGWLGLRGWHRRHMERALAKPRRDPAIQAVYTALQGADDERIGRPQRDAIADALAYYYASEHLTPADLEDRQQRLMVSRTRADLQQLVADLPL
ncbi:DUF1707 SHOCT-like domain-containing protein [Actinomadura rugatobispora]|uniref:DUF1707 domain-containing protein n=1 Tax=Actinomadura rugatobispora TaxID=1994 RepID=A0ABW0ZQE4_9ACTN|nr:hypothetical protein GCM10010200_036800 [Actinomadura rugatobispora]